VDDGAGDVVDDVLADPMMFVCRTGMGKFFEKRTGEIF
jgi:hypothetical protein